jgi:hypothetical protein
MPYKDPEIRKIRNRAYNSVWYKKNSAKHKAVVAANKAKHREEWQRFKSTLQCAKCGASHPAIIDFHHLDPSEKDKTVNQLFKNYSYKKIREELKKCIALCANCHRILHYEERISQQDSEKSSSASE